jgi:hypothetical protein
MFGRHTSTDTQSTDASSADSAFDERGERVMTRSAPGPGDAGGTTTRTRRRFRPSAYRAGSADPVAGDPAMPMGPAEETNVDGTSIGEPVTEPVAELPRRMHVSAAATLSVVVGTLAVAASLTGLLAPLGFAGGILAVLIGVVAVYAVRRPAVAGHSLVGLGVLFGLVAIVLAVLAMTGSVGWLTKSSDEIATVHNWLNDHMHWLRRW